MSLTNVEIQNFLPLEHFAALNALVPRVFLDNVHLKNILPHELAVTEAANIQRVRMLLLNMVLENATELELFAAI